MLLKIRGCKNTWWWEDCFYLYCWLNANIHTTTTVITSWISHNIKTPSLISWKECQHSSQGRKRVVYQALFHYHVVTELRLWPLLCYSIRDPRWSLWETRLQSCPTWRYLWFISDNTMHRMQMKQRNTVRILLLILGLGCSILNVFSPSSATETVLVKSFKVIQISNKLLHLLL